MPEYNVKFRRVDVSITFARVSESGEITYAGKALVEDVGKIEEGRENLDATIRKMVDRIVEGEKQDVEVKGDGKTP